MSSFGFLGKDSKRSGQALLSLSAQSKSSLDPKTRQKILDKDHPPKERFKLLAKFTGMYDNAIHIIFPQKKLDLEMM